MLGFITEKNLADAEKCFPGIGRFYAEMATKPATFLQLVWAFEESRAQQSACGSRAKSRRRR